jgi:hypothetical protein
VLSAPQSTLATPRLAHPAAPENPESEDVLGGHGVSSAAAARARAIESARVDGEDFRACEDARRLDRFAGRPLIPAVNYVRARARREPMKLDDADAAAEVELLDDPDHLSSLAHCNALTSRVRQAA